MAAGREPDAREPLRVVGVALLAAVWGGAGTIIADHLLADPGASQTTRVVAVVCAVLAGVWGVSVLLGSRYYQ